MSDTPAHRPDRGSVLIVGAGIAGLATALRLSHAGCKVTVLDLADGPGGKMRTVPSGAGPVDTGPTVLTMRPVFEALFADVEERLSDHLTLTPLATLARHFWDDGTRLDLMADEAQSAANIHATFGSRAERDFRRFSDRARRLYDAFDAPMMQAQAPSQLALTSHVMRHPRTALDMAPLRSLTALCRSSFAEPKLAQLFVRYATYVGGSPNKSPALLSLIANSEARGVWAVQGGMHRLAQTLEQLARNRGAVFHYRTIAERIAPTPRGGHSITTQDGEFYADRVVFNGDPRALRRGLLGPHMAGAVPASATDPRSLSAWVHAFAAKARGCDLAYHTVFFGHDARAEFRALDAGRTPRDATLYVCAQDRAEATAPTGPERFEIILNGVPATQGPPSQQEIATCQTQVFDRLAAFGLSFDPKPGPGSLSTPHTFSRRYPGSLGSLYGRSPHGMTAGLKRPTARTRVPRIYLCGGGAHPGAGIPMATLSAKHAAEAILADQTSTSTFPATATPGGTWTASAPTAPGPSRS